MTQTAEHTPGPWGIRKNPFGEPLIVAEGSKQLTVLAKIQVTDLRKSDNPEANAKLIAVAPDMAEALKELLFAQQHLLGQFDEADLAAVDKARTALKKAGVL